MLVFVAVLAVSTGAEAVAKAVAGLMIVRFLLFWSFRMMKILFDLKKKFIHSQYSTYLKIYLLLFHIDTNIYDISHL